MKQTLYELIREKLRKGDKEIQELTLCDPYFHNLHCNLSENFYSQCPINENEYILAFIINLCKVKNNLCGNEAIKLFNQSKEL